MNLQEITMKLLENNSDNNFYVYHATYLDFFDDIKNKGLLKSMPKNYGGEDDIQAIYFAYDYNVAGSFAECADEIDEQILDDGIIILAVKFNNLNSNKIIADPNILDENEDTFAYTENIPSNYLYIMNLKNKTYTNINDIGEITDEYLY